MSWDVLIAANEIEGKERHFIKEERGAFLLLKREGCWQAFAGLCPHAGAVLSYADCDNHSLECPFHGWRFNLDSGQCEFPQNGPPLGRFELKIEKDFVYIRREVL